MAKTKQNKKFFNLDDYEEFFKNEFEHRQEVKLLKNKIFFKRRKFMKFRAKEIAKNNKHINKKLALYKVRSDLKVDQSNKIVISKNAKTELKQKNRDFKDYSRNNNFLYKIANMTIKNLLIHFLLISVISIIILVPMALIGIGQYNIYIATLIGILVATYCAFIIAIPVWVALEKYRSLNKVKINHFLSTKEVDQEWTDCSRVNEYN